MRYVGDFGFMGQRNGWERCVNMQQAVNIADFQGKRVHFIGIGGVSMSGLAEILLHDGYTITGSDAHDSPLVAHLQQLGIVCQIGHTPELIERANLVVYTAAIHPDNPEFQYAAEHGLPMMDRATLLGEIMARFPVGIGISGTHGKTSCTSMLATLMEKAGLDPTIHLGGTLPLIGGSVKDGNGPVFITEACEYVESFLKLYPTIAVILNIDADHLDYFRDIDHIQSAFAAFLDRLPADGVAIGNGEDPRVMAVMRACGRRFVTFGLAEGMDYTARQVTFDEMGRACFSVCVRGEDIGRVTLSVPGRHHIYNALAALAAAAQAGLSPQEALPYLTDYMPPRRRFEKAGERDGVTIYHDYAHHPTEVRAQLAAASLLPHHKLWCVFQPHTYSRTLKLFEPLTACFADADEVLLTDIYAAREDNQGTICSKQVAEAITNTQAQYMDSFAAAADYLKAHWHSGDIVVTMGAGDIEGFSRLLLKD